MATRHRPPVRSLAEHTDLLVERARRLRRRGDTRKMLVALREACMHDEGAAWLWSMYGALLAHEGRLNEATSALKHALWLRRAAHDRPRIRSTQALLDRLVAHAA